MSTADWIDTNDTVTALRAELAEARAGLRAMEDRADRLERERDRAMGQREDLRSAGRALVQRSADFREGLDLHVDRAAFERFRAVLDRIAIPGPGNTSEAPEAHGGTADAATGQETASTGDSPARRREDGRGSGHGKGGCL